MLQSIVDFGLLVLIWMVQLVVYPSFLHFREEDLLKWHSIYTGKIALLVIPLMLAQLILYMYKVITDPTLVHIIAIIIIAAIWALTFFVAVPLHDCINSGREVYNSSRKLVRINWFRTVFWTILFIWSLYHNEALSYWFLN